MMPGRGPVPHLVTDEHAEERDREGEAEPQRRRVERRGVRNGGSGYLEDTRAERVLARHEGARAERGDERGQE